AKLVARALRAAWVPGLETMFDWRDRFLCLARCRPVLSGALSHGSSFRIVAGCRFLGLATPMSTHLCAGRLRDGLCDRDPKLVPLTAGSGRRNQAPVEDDGVEAAGLPPALTR